MAVLFFTGPIDMLYFAYGSNLNARAVSGWCRHHGHRAPPLQGGRPAVLDNYRLGFPVFSEYWGGGIADIVYDPGKYVMGVLLDVADAELDLLDRKVGRERDASGKEVGVYGRVEIKAAQLGKGEPVRAVTYQGVNIDRNHVPPTQNYMDLLIQGACAHGLSAMWVAYLQTFDTQPGRKPRPLGASPSALYSGERAAVRGSAIWNLKSQISNLQCAPHPDPLP